LAEIPSDGRLGARSVSFHRGGGDTVACRLQATGELALIPAFLAEFLGSCSGFRTLDGQIARFGEQHQLPVGQREALKDSAAELAKLGLLISDEAVYRAIGGGEMPGRWGSVSQPSRLWTGSNRGETPVAVAPSSRQRDRMDPADNSPSSRPPIGCIGVPTAGSPERLGRCLRAALDNAAAHGRRPRVLVADNSRDPSVAEINRALAERIGREYGVPSEWIGNEGRARYAADLARKAGCDRAVVEFALCDPGPGTFAAGINRNMLLLAGAGHPMLSLDDDAVCRVSRRVEPDAALRFVSLRDPMVRRFFPDREQALDAFREVPLDFLGEHEQLLGSGLGDLVERLDPERDGLVEGSVHAEFVERLMAGGGSVIATYTGQYLDPGIPTSCYYLWMDSKNLSRLAESETLYRRAMKSRAAAGQVPGPVIGDFTLSSGLAFGLDLREVLPPFFPHYHAEDFSHGTLLMKSVPRGFSGYPACSILHDPGPNRPILAPEDLPGERPVSMFEIAHVLRSVVQGARSMLPDASRTDAIAGIGRHFLEFAGNSERAFEEAWKEQVLLLQGSQFDRLERRLWSDEVPEYVRADTERMIHFLQGALSEPDFDLPLDVRDAAETPSNIRARIRRELRLFGELLLAWPALFEAARGRGGVMGSGADEKLGGRASCEPILHARLEPRAPVAALGSRTPLAFPRALLLGKRSTAG
jgi:hypothetical protein